MKYYIALTAVLACLLLPSSILATLGVGVGTGKIQVQDKLKPGIIYDLPPLTVLNTGDETSKYEVTVTYHENQPEKRPDVSWFMFEPKTFSLEAGQVQVVTMRVNLPLNAQPGDYFGYLEAHPAKGDSTENTSVGIAAAAKLYFSVIPANIVAGIYYKGLSLWRIYSPWPQRILLVVGLVLAYTAMKRFLHIEINVKKPQSKPIPKDSEEQSE